MRFVFRISVEVERETGKFISRDEINDELREALESADPGSVDIDESSYAVVDWDVAEDVVPGRKR